MDPRLFRDRKSAVQLTGFVPHKEALRFMEETDYLLLPWRDRYNVPGKLYEYVATKKPILGLVQPGSDAYSILKETGNASLADIDDPAAVERCLLQLVERGPAPREEGARADLLRQYARPNIAARYARLIRAMKSTPAAQLSRRLPQIDIAKMKTLLPLLAAALGIHTVWAASPTIAVARFSPRIIFGTRRWTAFPPRRTHSL